MIRTFLLIVLLFTASSLWAETPTDKWGSVPLLFESNEGQTDLSVRFLSRGAGYGLFFTDKEAIVAMTRPEPATIRMRVVGQSENASIEALEPHTGRSHYF